jgi:hypothetical protein
LLEDQIHDGSRAIIRLLGTPQGSAGDTFRLRGLRDIGSRHYARFGACKIRRAAEVFYKQALSGDVQSAQLVSKLIERRCIILGLHTPQTAVVQLVAEVPKATSTDRIEAALNALIKDQRGKGEKPN